VDDQVISALASLTLCEWQPVERSPERAQHAITMFGCDDDDDGIFLSPHRKKL
jgi:hypothetical protein